MIENVTPILRADDLAATKRYYLDVLGFAVNWEVPYMLSVVRDGHPLMICDGHQGQRGMWLWIGVEDVDALYAEFVAKGALIRDPPNSFEWGYEFQVEDPNGHVLRFASEPRSGPYDAEFKT
jgi:predicted enzyme related to lactoylglutathione lyase